MTKQLIIADADEIEQVQLYVLAPSIRPGILWVDLDDMSGYEPVGVTMDMDRRGATALRDFLTEWLDSLDDVVPDALAQMILEDEASE